MSDAQSRPAVPRGGRPSAARGGRGGFASRGARNPVRNGDAKHDDHDAPSALEDDDVTKELKKTYASELVAVKGIFPEWADIDILYALQEYNGDATTVIERIIDGAVPQWESSQKKDRSKAKAKDTFTTTTGADIPLSNNNRISRGGRPEAARGRGRATDRGGRGATRGRSAAAPTNGAHKESQPLSVPTDASNAWDTSKNNDDGGWASAAAATSWEPATSSDSTASAPAQPVFANPEPVKSAVIPQGTSMSWAGMLRQSVVPKPAPQPPKEPEPVLEPLPAAAPEPMAAPEPEIEPETIAELSAEPSTEHSPAVDSTVVVPEVALPPSNDQLTKTNLEQVTDVSHPPETDTAASEAADSWDPRAAAGSVTATPISASQAQHQAPHKAHVSGYAASAIKATERAPIPRVPTQQRRFLDQQEAVRMPSAASQQLEQTSIAFGAFNLNGTEEDIDGDREEPETRAQPPADSPVAQPRAALPPAPQQAPDAYTAQKPASSLPGAAPTGPQAAPTAPAAQQPIAQAAAPQIPTHPAAQQQYARFGQTASDQPGFAQKPFDNFNQSSQPLAPQSHYDGFSQQQAPTQPQAQQTAGPYSSAAEPFSTYYASDPQSRTSYNNGYNSQYNYGQQQQQGQGHEGGHTSRAGFGAYGAAQPDSHFPGSGRFGNATAHEQNSGPSTPVPQASQGPPASQAHVGQQQHGAYNYQQQQQQQQPYYNQFAQGYQAGYPSPYGGYQGGAFGGYNNKTAGGYGQQSQHYGQQQAYDHASTGSSGYAQSSLHRDAGAPGLGEYGRQGAQPGVQPGLGGAGFGAGIHDTFARGNSYGAQAGQAFNAASTQPGDDLKFGDGKTAGPSPAMGGARPGSATNPGQAQGGLPPPQSQQGMGAYGGAAGFPGQLGGHGLHGAQSGSGGYGMGGGSAQGQQHTAYSSYANTGFGSGGNNSYYQQQQQRGGGGWGNNYNNAGAYP